MKRIVSFITVLVLLASLLVLPAGAVSEDSNVIADARHGVVRFLTINTKTGSAAVGSGFALGKAGTSTDIFATNFHVIEDTNIQYILLDNDWKKSVPEYGGTADNVHAVRCEIVYENGDVPDFAIMRTQRVITERICLPLMYSNLAHPGDTVFALGYPAVVDFMSGMLADIDSMTVTRGTLSRFTTLDSRGSVNVIQTDAHWSGGNSGGPLVTEEGYIIGLNTWTVTEDKNYHMSLVIDYVIEKLDELISNGTLSNFQYTLITERASDETQPQETTPANTDEPEETAFNPLILGLIALCAATAGLSLYLVLMLKKKIEHTRALRAATVAKAVPTPATAAKTGPSPVSQFVLNGISGQYAGKQLLISKEMRLGRSHGNDIVFDQATPGVSGNHCVFLPGSNGITVMDVGSSNGTYLANGTKLIPNQKYDLHAGDMLYIGSKHQCFRVDLPGAPAAPLSVPMASIASAKYTLTAVSGPLAGKKYPISKELRLGRSSENDVVFPGSTPGISRQHCTLVPREDGVILIDQDSTSGTFAASGRKLPAKQKVLVKKGDSFYLGNRSNLFRIE